MRNDHVRFARFLAAAGVFTVTAYLANIAFVLWALFAVATLIVFRHNANPLYAISLWFLAPLATPDLATDDVFFLVFLAVVAAIALFDAFKRQRFHTLGKLGIALVIFLDVSLLGLIFSRNLDAALPGILALLVALLAYVYFINVIPFDKSLFHRVAQLLVTMAIVSTVTHAFTALANWMFIGDVIAASTLNVYPHLLAVPFIIHRIRHAELRAPWVVGLFFVAGGVLLSGSYARLFTLTSALLLFVPYWFLPSNRKVKIALIVSGTFALSALFAAFIPFYALCVERLFGAFMPFIDAQLAAMRLGVRSFAQNIIIGVGGLGAAQTLAEEAGETLTGGQSLWVDTATLGLLGVGAFIYLQVRKVLLIARIETSMRYVFFVLFVSVVIIGGAFDAVYYHTGHLLMLLFVLACAERSALTTQARRLTKGM